MVWAASWLCVVITALPTILPTAQRLHSIDGSPSPILDKLVHCPLSWWPADLIPTPIFLYLLPQGLPMVSHSCPITTSRPSYPQPQGIAPPGDPFHLLSSSQWHCLRVSLCGRSSLLCTLVYISTSLMAQPGEHVTCKSSENACWLMNDWEMGLNNCPSKSHVLKVWCPRLWHYWDMGEHLRRGDLGEVFRSLEVCP